MSIPQLEQGYTRIANGILQSLARFKLGSYHYRVLFVIFLKTYGFNKKEDWVAISQFAEATDILEPHVCRAVKELINMNIVTKGGNKVSFQKDARLWKKLPKGVRSHHVTKGGNTITKGGNQELPKGVDTKDTLTKDTIQKTIIQGTELSVIENQKELKRPDTLTDHSVSHYVIELFRDLNPDVARLHKLKGEADAAITLYRNAVKGNLDQLERAIKAIPEIAGDTFAPKDIKSISKPSQLLTHWALYCAQARGRKEKITKLSVTRL